MTLIADVADLVPNLPLDKRMQPLLCGAPSQQRVTKNRSEVHDRDMGMGLVGGRAKIYIIHTQVWAYARLECKDKY